MYFITVSSNPSCSYTFMLRERELREDKMKIQYYSICDVGFVIDVKEKHSVGIASNYVDSCHGGCIPWSYVSYVKIG